MGDWLGKPMLLETHGKLGPLSRCREGGPWEKDGSPVSPSTLPPEQGLLLSPGRTANYLQSYIRPCRLACGDTEQTSLLKTESDEELFSDNRDAGNNMVYNYNIELCSYFLFLLIGFLNPNPRHTTHARYRQLMGWGLGYAVTSGLPLVDRGESDTG